MTEDELTETERRTLDVWTTLTPPPGFADRVVAAREPAAKRRRWPLVAAGLTAVCGAAAIAIIVRSPSHAATGSLDAVAVRTTTPLGDRAVAVAEPAASLAWRIDDDGAAEIEQRAGDVFYRVDRGGPFVVHTPAGDVRVTGTCFRIEVPMNPKLKQAILSGTAGAALATAVVVTVYEGHVVAENHSGRTELVAGSRATMEPDGRATQPTLADAIAKLPVDEAHATREQLVERAIAQAAELKQLRARLAELEKGRGGDSSAGEEGRAWYDPSPERLREWVAKCHIRFDEPGLDRFAPLTPLVAERYGIEPAEVASVNSALGEVAQQWKQLVRAAYVEATGDAAGADTLSVEAMRHEVSEKGADDSSHVLQRISRERAGLEQPPTDLSKLPAERVLRAQVELGAQSEAALAKKLGAARAKELRGDGWPQRSDRSGCPDK